ncbi:serine/threonine-protein phosphatase [Geodermatophilus sp. TF02-6]|uniref:PP2C family protein-serine/threonine phosphatase n=1 Tax=Geodermatophilus sp. TF02-6 TaxID=2250575 RepID=UPI000DE8E1D1|nr:protein phosphatase 2C domain-containing protein [Geodermatophilus sp. TF02-6]RBY75315.1 serine/threonine-protein phosphatase [Geodermatophilus sp. TF02-6]
MPPVELSWGAATAVGQREDNQDRYLAELPVFAVADGMGGHAGGAAAAQAVVEALGSLTGGGTTTVAAIRSALQRADGEIRTFTGPDRAGAGTTVAGVALVDEGDGPQWAVFHIGDSRVYRWHDGELEPLTTDHSVVQELLDAGYISDASVATHPQRHIITRALGVGPRSEPDVTLRPVVPGERFLACSDGLTGVLDDDRIAELMATDAVPDDHASRLADEAVARGAQDNVTVVDVEVRGSVG